jgi:acetyl-CoA carboxylase biotin carboxyl carrier protein
VSSDSDLSHNEVTRILDIVDKLNDIEVRVEIDGMKLHVRKYSAEVPQGRSMFDDAPIPRTHAPTPTPAITLETTLAKNPLPVSAAQAGTIAIRAPMLGRFFRASSPTDAPFVEIGSRVEPDDTVCIIEVMKLFCTVKAGVRGTIASIAVENAEMVEHDAVLFTVSPE